MKNKSQLVVIESPMSFTGSAKRLWKLTWVTNVWLKWLILVPVALIVISVAWFVIVFWYMIFGILLIPYRLIRRSGRKNKRDNFRHHEILEAIDRDKR